MLDFLVQKMKLSITWKIDDLSSGFYRRVTKRNNSHQAKIDNVF